MQLLVRHNKRTLTVDGLRAEDDVSVLAARIERKTRVPRAKSWLQFEHTRLEPGRSLGACGLSAGSTVHLAVRGRGGGCVVSKVEERKVAPEVAAGHFSRTPPDSPP